MIHVIKTIQALDKQLREELKLVQDRRTAHLGPYLLRAKALEEELSPYALGRAIYHLAQRRGFLSNMKTGRGDDNEQGKVKAGISELSQKMLEAKAPTLGAYFAKLDPDEQRIRERWTSRQMYVDEFKAIWEAQQPYHSLLTEEFREQIVEAIFNQRPLKSQKGLIGKCELEPLQASELLKPA